MHAGLFHGTRFEPHFILEHVKDLWGAVHGVRANRKDVGLAILHGLKHPSHVMTEALCQGGRILPREQSTEIRGLRRIAPKQFDGVLPFEHTGHLVAREEDRDLARSRGQPLHELPLGMRIRPVHLIQYQTHRHLVSSKEGRNTACILTRLCQRVNVCETAKGPGRIELECLEATRPGGCKRERGLPNPRGSMEKDRMSIRRALEIRTETGLDLCMPRDAIKELGALCFTPHSPVFVGV